MPKVHAQESSDTTRGRRGNRARISPTLSEINVVPLVDVMLVLLIIFMVAAPMMQRGIDVNLPVSERAPQITDERVVVTVPVSFRDDGRIQLDDESIPLDVLAERMRQSMEGRTQREVFLRGDGTITLQELLTVIDRLKEGGVERVGVLSKLPGER